MMLDWAYSDLVVLKNADKFGSLAEDYLTDLMGAGDTVESCLEVAEDYCWQTWWAEQASDSHQAAQPERSGPATSRVVDVTRVSAADLADRRILAFLRLQVRQPARHRV